MDLKALLLAPLLIPERTVRLLDDVNALAERARREPDPVEEVRARIDVLIAEIAQLLVVAREIRDGGADLKETTDTLHADTRELIDGGSRLTAVSEDIEQHLGVFRAALPRILELEQAVETVADTVEPLQGAAERVGRVTNRLSRRS